MSTSIRYCSIFFFAIALASRPSIGQDLDKELRPAKHLLDPASEGGADRPKVAPPVVAPDGPRKGALATTPLPASSSASQSLFDAAKFSFKPVVTSVEVTASEHDRDILPPAPRPIQISGEEIITAAGSYGDILRYLQILPGVVSTSDTSNEILVRGGHPIENLYLVEGIEIPNINHMATLGTTGGFAPMIDSAVVQGMTLHTGGYDAGYSDRLSSVTEINLLNSANASGHTEADFGIQGIGGLVQTKMHRSDLLVSGHHGLLDTVTQNAGINGVPSYTNELTRLRFTRPSGDRFTLLNVAGWDSIEITPCESDPYETSTINSQYAGWRETTGLQWQHGLTGRSFGVATVTDSEQVQHIHQQEQFLDYTTAHHTFHPCPLPKGSVQTTPVYMEDTNSAVSSASYRYEWASSQVTIAAGTTAWLQRPNFQIQQPLGAYSPYSAARARTDVASIDTNFSTGETGSFAELTYRGIRNLSLGGGFRVQTFAIGGHTEFSYRSSARYRFGNHFAANAAFATYAQLPPYIYLLAYPQNHSLLPMRVRHAVLGFDIDAAPWSQVHLEAYHKPYFDTPASSEYGSVTLHSMPDMLGDEIVWLPMNSKGHGQADGLELSDTTRIHSRALIKASLAYSRAKFAGQDNVLRPSNFDFPWILNVLSNLHVGRGLGVSTRYGYATGRPYTPYDMKDSLAQNRPIYDLAHLNAPRAPYYGRLDAQLNKDIPVRDWHLEIYAGVDNIFNRQNFLSYAWMPVAQTGQANRYPVKELYQMPIFPNLGIRFIVH